MTSPTEETQEFILPEQHILDIINSELNLPVDHAWVRDQNKEYPNTPDMFIVAGMVFSKVISTNSTATPSAAGMTETQSTITQDSIQIDVLSRNIDALQRRYEVLAALNSFYSEQVQELNNFKIYPIATNFINTSIAEGGSQINRFSITITCQVGYQKVKPLSSIYGDYFDTFPVRVDDSNTVDTDQGIIEFTEPTT